MLHAQDKETREPPRRFSLRLMMRFHLGRQDRNAQQRREQDGDDPRHDQGHGNHDEQSESEFAGVAAVEANGMKSGDGNERARQHRKGGRRVDVGRRLR